MCYWLSFPFTTNTDTDDQMCYWLSFPFTSISCEWKAKSIAHLIICISISCEWKAKSIAHLIICISFSCEWKAKSIVHLIICISISWSKTKLETSCMQPDSLFAQYFYRKKWIQTVYLNPAIGVHFVVNNSLI
jgi:hypothetical protein